MNKEEIQLNLLNVANSASTIIIFHSITNQVSKLVANIRQLYYINDEFVVCVAENKLIFMCNYILTDIYYLLLNDFKTVTIEENDGYSIFNVT